MNIASILERYESSSGVGFLPYLLVGAAGLIAMLVVMFLVSFIASEFNKRKKLAAGEAVEQFGEAPAGMAVLSLILGAAAAGGVVYAGGQMFGFEDDRKDAVVAMTLAANRFYDVELSEQDIEAAWDARDTEVVMVSTVHEGKVKAVGVSIDESTGGLYVYEGAEVLPPAS